MEPAISWESLSPSAQRSFGFAAGCAVSSGHEESAAQVSKVNSRMLLVGLLWAHELDSEPLALIEHFDHTRNQLDDELVRNTLAPVGFDPRRKQHLSLTDLPDLSANAGEVLEQAIGLARNVPEPPDRLPLRFLFGGILGVGRCGAYRALHGLLRDGIDLTQIASSYTDFLAAGPGKHYRDFLRERYPRYEPTQLKGLEVSSQQHVADWRAVPEAGFVFAAAIATVGAADVDPAFADNWRGMREAGIKARVACHRLQLDQDGVVQAENFLRAARAAGGIASSELPALVLESDVTIADTASFVGTVASWVGHVRESLRKLPVICADAQSLEALWQRVAMDDPIRSCPRWVIALGVDLPELTGGTTPVLWRYRLGSPDDPVSGVTGDPNLDRLLVSVDEFMRLARPERSEIDINPRAYSDQPTCEDTLGLAPLVDGLHALVSSEKTKLPLALAVTAEWGAGKSSLMCQLCEGLLDDGESKRRWYVVWFDAWKYEQSDRMWAALAKAIYRQVQDRPRNPAGRDGRPKQMRPWERVRFRWRVERRRQPALALVAKTVGPPVAVFGAILAAIASLSDVSAPAIPLTLGPLVALAASVGHVWGVASQPFTRAIDSYAKRDTAQERMGFTPDADQDVTSMIDALTLPTRKEKTPSLSGQPRPQPALAVFVDDLDRCTPRNVVDVVEAINQIFNSVDARPCLFLVAMDREMVASSIDVSYREMISQLKRSGSGTATGFGLRFLAKLVQMSVAIPRPTPSSVAGLLEEMTGAKPPEEIAAARATPDRVDALRRQIRQAGPANPADAAREGRQIAAGQQMDPAEEAALTEALRKEQARLFETDSPDVARAEFEALPYLGGNPRQVKRFDNAFRLQLHVANGSPQRTLDFTPDQLAVLAKWVALRLRWPALAVAIDGHPDLLKELETRANNETSLPDALSGLERFVSWFGEEEILDMLREPDLNRRLTSDQQLSDALLRMI